MKKLITCSTIVLFIMICVVTSITAQERELQDVIENLEKQKTETQKNEEINIEEINTEPQSLYYKKMNLKSDDRELNKLKAQGYPVWFLDASISFNAIDDPEAKISLMNISSKIIDAYTVDIYCYDRFGRPVVHYAHDSNVFGGKSKDTIQPGDTDKAAWRLHGHENTSKIKVFIREVHFSDGGTWSPKKPLYITGKSSK